MPYKRVRSHSRTESSTRTATTTAAYRPSDRAARRFLFFLIGLWFGAVLCIALVLPRSLASVDHVMMTPAPEAAQAIKDLGPVNARMLLRYQISEANRNLLGVWGWAQLALGLIMFGIVLFGTSAGRTALAFSAGMLLLACLVNFLVIPRMGEISRNLDFTPPSGVGMGEDQFQLLHRGFIAFEGVALLLGAFLFGVLAKRRRTRSESAGGDGFSAPTSVDQFD